MKHLRLTLPYKVTSIHSFSKIFLPSTSHSVQKATDPYLGVLARTSGQPVYPLLFFLFQICNCIEKFGKRKYRIVGMSLSCDLFVIWTQSLPKSSLSFHNFLCSFFFNYNFLTTASIIVLILELECARKRSNLCLSSTRSFICFLKLRISCS